MNWIDFEDITYIGLFLALMGGALGLPIPEDLPLLAAGALANQGALDVRIAFVVCYAAILLGDTVIFFVGKRLGPSLFEQEWFKRRVPSSRIRLIRQKLSKRSILTILVARHLFYLRTVTFLTCGAVGMRFSRFIAADAIAALISAPLIMSLGYFASEHFDAIMHNAHLVIAGLLIVLTIFYTRRQIARYRSRLLKKVEKVVHHSEGRMSE